MAQRLRKLLMEIDRVFPQIAEEDKVTNIRDNERANGKERGAAEAEYPEVKWLDLQLVVFCGCFRVNWHGVVLHGYEDEKEHAVSHDGKHGGIPEGNAFFGVYDHHEAERDQKEKN